MTERTRAGLIAAALRPRLRVPRRGILAIGIGLLAVWPAAASAAPVNRASDRAALNAYHAYLHDLVSLVPTWRQDDNTYINSISGQCGGVFKHAAISSFNKKALLTFSLEAGGDLDAVSVYPSTRPVLGKLAGSLASLHWSSAGIRNVVSAYVAAERRLVTVGPSNLCADARALEASHGQRVSHGTAAFAVKFAHRVVAADRAGSAFLTVLAKFATPSEHGLITSTAHLLHQFGLKIAALAVPEAKKLVSVLAL